MSFLVDAISKWKVLPNNFLFNIYSVKQVEYSDL